MYIIGFDADDFYNNKFNKDYTDPDSGKMNFIFYHRELYNQDYSSSKATVFSLLSPQHVAASIGDIELFKFLISKGLRAEEYFNKEKITPLLAAIMAQQEEMIRFLLLELKPTTGLNEAFIWAIANADLKTNFAIRSGNNSTNRVRSKQALPSE